MKMCERAVQERSGVAYRQTDRQTSRREGVVVHTGTKGHNENDLRQTGETRVDKRARRQKCVWQIKVSHSLESLSGFAHQTDSREARASDEQTRGERRAKQRERH
mmetsp:Transcript_16884/g.48121  ORF Transcript_16884/g.48121 Transcript_16884/m.48121 type:complete len:105 (-) Transcript_16884:99-413(-)